jgi:hypothetical protein
MRHRCLRFLQSRPQIDETNLIEKKCDIDASDSSYRSHEYTNPAYRNCGKNQVVWNIIVEIIDSGFEHFMICKYVYNIQPLGKCFLNTSINESCQEGWWKKSCKMLLWRTLIVDLNILSYSYMYMILNRWGNGFSTHEYKIESRHIAY